MTMKEILSDYRIKEMIPASVGKPYKWEFVLESGYRFKGYESHTVNVVHTEEYSNLTIEQCPDDCDCKQENKL